MAKKLKPLNDKEIAFRDYYLESGDYKYAYMMAGYVPDPGNAYKKLIKIHRHIRQAIMAKIGGHAVFALDKLVHLAQNATSETVQLNAVKDLLNRAGYMGDANEIDDSLQEAKEMPIEKLEDELRALTRKAKAKIAKETS